jgi:hypothetical protein
MIRKPGSNTWGEMPDPSPGPKPSRGVLPFLVACVAVFALFTYAPRLDLAPSTPKGATAVPSKSDDCSGTNGNAAVAACHPDDSAIQTACPDNSNGEKYAAPTDECLEAVRASSYEPRAARPVAGQGHPLRADSSCADWVAADRASKQAFLAEAIGTVNINLRTDAIDGMCAYEVKQGQSDSSIGESAYGLASERPQPAPSDGSAYLTIDPEDPHQCADRTSQIPGALTDNVVPADCYAMGM